MTTSSESPADVAVDRTRSERRGIRRRASLSLLLGALLLSIGGLVYAALSTVALGEALARQEIRARLAELSGLPVTIEASGGGFSLLPRARLSLSNIRIGTPGSSNDAVLHIGGIVADLDFWQALLGRTHVERLRLIRPELMSSNGFMKASSPPAAGPRLATARSPVGDDGTYRAMSNFFGAFLSRFEDLRVLEIRDGVFRMAPETGSLGISNANISVSWPSPHAPAHLTGSYVWNGQPAELELQLAAPLDFLDGRRSAIDLKFVSPPLTASFQGEGASGHRNDLAGRLRLATPSLSRAIRWLHDPRARVPDFGPMAIEADIIAADRKVNLQKATVTLDGFAGEGALEMVVANGGRPAFGGTLAFGQLDLTGFAEAIAPMPQTPLEFQRRIALGFVDGLDLDLRLSADRGSLGPLVVNDLAATVKFKQGVATLDIGDAAVLGGEGQMRVEMDTRVGRPVVKGLATLRRVESARLFEAMAVSSVGITGLTDIDAEIEAPVTNWADIFKQNSMGLKVIAHGGVLSGFNPRILLGEGTKPLALATAGTAIPYRTLEAVLRSRGSRVDLDTVSVESDAGALEASGVVSTSTKAVDVTGSFAPVGGKSGGTAEALTTPKPIGFRIQGDWPSPSVTTVPSPGPMRDP